MQANSFSKRMETLSDRDLFEILEDADNFDPAAVDAVKLEIKKRGLAEDKIEELSFRAEYDKQVKDNKVNIPLSTSEKWLIILAFFFVLPGWYFSFASIMRMKANGYERKYQEAWKYYGLSYLIPIGLVLLILMFNDMF